MENTYWHKQTSDKPLFPDLLWSRPENRQHAGKLLIVGGASSGFSEVGEAYAGAISAGIGTARVILPKSLEKTVLGVFPEAEFAPANPSGGFGRGALATLLDEASWADGVLLAGNLGKNSETSVLLESFISKYSGQLTLTGDSLDFFLARPETLLNREQTAVVPGFAQLQKLAAACGVAITSQMGLVQLVESLHELSRQTQANWIAVVAGQTIIAVDGQVSTTPAEAPSTMPRLAAGAAVWTLQNPTQIFESLTVSLVTN